MFLPHLATEIRKSSGMPVTTRLVSAIILSCLLQCYAGWSSRFNTGTIHESPQRTAHLVYELKPWPWGHITFELHSLHWLPIRQQIEFRLCLLVHLVTIWRTPSCLIDKIKIVSDVQAVPRSALNRGQLLCQEHVVAHQVGDRV